jgi:putative FmdB family regulatory protein
MGRHLQFAVPFTNNTMPIYAYRCTSCGHAKDVLRRMSDPPLSVCPACGAATFAKQVTAAGFQLKGSGWYVTDFRGDKNAKKPADAAAAPAGDAAAKPASEATAAKPAGEAAPSKPAGEGTASKPAGEGGASKPAAAPAAPGSASSGSSDR